MTQIILFTVVAAVLYLVSDWILNYVEVRRGQRFEHRSIIFLVIIMILAFSSFSLIEHLTKKPSLEAIEKINGQIQKVE